MSHRVRMRRSVARVARTPITFDIGPFERGLTQREQCRFERATSTREGVFDSRRCFGVCVTSEHACSFESLQSIGQSSGADRRQRRDQLGGSHRSAQERHYDLQRPSVADDAE